MPATVVFASPLLSVIDYRCTATPADRPFTESHERYSLAYVRKGSFGCSARGKAFELVPGPRAVQMVFEVSGVVARLPFVGA